VEALHIGVFHRLAGTDEHQLDSPAIGPEIERPGDELEAMIDDQTLRQAALPRELAEGAGAGPGQRFS
jgi:hypothetical protein